MVSIIIGGSLNTFWTQQVFRLERDQWVPIDKPPGAEVGFFRDQLLLQLRKDWVLRIALSRVAAAIALKISSRRKERFPFCLSPLRPPFMTLRLQGLDPSQCTG